MTFDELKSRLADSYPETLGAKDVPLAVGIREQIIEAHPDIPQKVLRRLLGARCGRARYLKSLQVGEPRFNLDGTVGGSVTPQQAEHAKQRLKNLNAPKVVQTVPRTRPILTLKKRKTS